MRKVVAIILMGIIVLSITVSIAESGFSISGISEATDEELENARLAIIQEQRNRLHIEVIISPNDISIKKGGTKKLEAAINNMPDDLKAGKFVWTSSNEKVAKVNSTGVVQGISSGNAIITCSVTLSDGMEISSICNINVIVPIQSVKSTTPKVTLQMNKTQKLDFTFQPSDATTKKLTFSSSDSSIVTVDESGLIKAVSGGKATITATTTDGSDKTTKVDVYVPSLAGGTTLKFNKLDADSNGRIKPVEYSFSYYGKGKLSVKSSNTKLFTCKLTKSGKESIIKVTPKRAGSGTITITDSNDINSKLVVDVTISSSAVYPEVKKGSMLSLSNGQTIQITSVSFTQKVTHKMYKIGKQYDWDASYGNTYMLIKATNGNKTGRNLLGKNTVQLWYSFDGGSTDYLTAFPTNYNSYYPMFFQSDNTDYISNGSSIEMMYFGEVNESKKNCKDIWIYVKDSSHNTIGIYYHKESQ